eukprot:363585-Chlamydomonas_euryale.AAC.12
MQAPTKALANLVGRSLLCASLHSAAQQLAEQRNMPGDTCLSHACMQQLSTKLVETGSNAHTHGNRPTHGFFSLCEDGCTSGNVLVRMRKGERGR